MRGEILTVMSEVAMVGRLLTGLSDPTRQSGPYEINTQHYNHLGPGSTASLQPGTRDGND